MTVTTFVILLVLLLISVVLCVYLFVERRHLRADMQQQTDAHTDARQQMSDTFKALAGDALKQSSEQFLHLADQRLQNQQNTASQDLDQRKKAIEQLVKPLKETLDKYNTAVHDVEKSRIEAYGSLRTQLGALVEDQRTLRDETANLVKALRRPEVRGRWGEIQLKRVVELAGMIDRCDFDEQVTITADGQTQRPDMVINLPNNRTIVIDAKTPLDAYLNSIEAKDEDQQRTFLETHAQQIMRKVNDLSTKGYIEQFHRSPEFVVLFIPGEPFLYAAVQVRPDLIEAAMAKNVIIATPSTLISLLKAVAAGWREQKLAENAQLISEAGAELHLRLCTAIKHLADVGNSLTSTTNAYNRFVGSFESRVMVQARKFEELGAAANTKQLPDTIEPVEKLPRDVKASSPPQ
jgi:DNA recombination protein RmuC